MKDRIPLLIILMAIFAMGLSPTGCSRVKSPVSSMEIPVFPGAQGFGIETPAGKGGKILKVTNLEGRGKGSLRAAVEESGPRTIVFEVSGVIRLADELAIVDPFCTIAGQTAPPPGITLIGRRLRIATHDVLIQHIRSRPGDSPGVKDEIEDRDSVTIQDYENPIFNVVIDHCSFSWAVDEVVGFWGYGDKVLKNCTISNSIVSEGLDVSLKGHSHSKGILVGNNAKNIAIVGNLLSSNKDRNPLFKGDTSGVVVNNLIYNSGLPGQMLFADDAAQYAQKGGPILVSAAGNVFHDGPAHATDGPLWFNPNVSRGTKVYLSQNLCLRIDDRRCDVPWVSGFPPWGSPIVPAPPVWAESVGVRPVATVESNVLANAGARPAERFTPAGDPVDERIVREVRTHGGSIKNSVAEAGGWPIVSPARRIFDPPENPNADDDQDGYSNLEEVLHRMAADVETRGT